MATAKEKVGQASLWTAILGSLLPIAGWAVVDALVVPGREQQGYALCLLLFVLLEAVALVCGVIGRHTIAGKMGLGIAATSLGLSVLCAAFWFLVL